MRRSDSVLSWSNFIAYIDMHTCSVDMFSYICSSVMLGSGSLKVSEYDQEIPQSHTADQPTAP